MSSGGGVAAERMTVVYSVVRQVEEGCVHCIVGVSWEVWPHAMLVIVIVRVVRCTSRTVTYAKKLSSVYICYSQRNGFNTPLSVICNILHTVHVAVNSVVSVTYQSRTSDSLSKYYVFVCTRSTSPRIHRLPHLDHYAPMP